MRKQQSTIHYLEEYILMCLDEIKEADMTEFLLGETYAYIECLEIIWESFGIDNKTMLALEAKYGIR